MKITKIKELLEKGVYTNQEIAELVDCTDRYVRKVKAKLPFALHCEERGIDIDNVDFYWDNLEFFLNSSMKEIKEECKQEMKEKLHYDKKLLMDIKKHLKYMKKEGYLK